MPIRASCRKPPWPAPPIPSARCGRAGRAAARRRAAGDQCASSTRRTNPLALLDFGAKTTLLGEIDAFARARDPRVKQVMASMYGEWQAVQILRADGTRVADIRPLVRLNVAVVVEQDGRRETGSHGIGGRAGFDYARIVTEDSWKAAVDEALRQALVNLDSVPAPAGEMEVVLGPGWPGILLHEAIGHGLEGDFNRKKT